MSVSGQSSPPLSTTLSFSRVLVWSPVPSRSPQESVQLDQLSHSAQRQSTKKSFHFHQKFEEIISFDIFLPGQTSSQGREASGLVASAASSHSAPSFTASVAISLVLV